MPRQARDADICQVAGIYHDVWHETHARFVPEEERDFRTLEFFVDRMTTLRPTTLVEERDRSIVGFAAWQGPLLGQIFVLPGHRGTGVAADLLAAAERDMMNSGTQIADLHCVVGNDPARRFYERMGWQHAGELQEFVRGEKGPVGLAFWRMTKRLFDERSLPR